MPNLKEIQRDVHDSSLFSGEFKHELMGIEISASGIYVWRGGLKTETTEISLTLLRDILLNLLPLELYPKTMTDARD